VFHTGNGVAKPVWNNANKVNHANHFVPRPVQLNSVRQNVNSVRPNVNSVRTNVNSVRPNVNSVRTNVNTVRQNVNSVRSNVNTVRPKQPVSTSNSNSFSPVRPQDHPLKNIEDRGIFDSGCSGHMTGNTDHLDDFEECKGGSVTFRAVTQPSPYEPLPSSSPPPVIFATTESEPTPVAKLTTHLNSLSLEPGNEPIEHTFEQPSSEHQPLSPRQETETSQSQDPTHLHVAEERTMTVDDLLQLVPMLIKKVDSLEKELKQTKLTIGKAIVKLVKKGRNLQEEGLDEMVRSIMKDKSKDFKTLTQGNTSGEADISPEGLEAAETLANIIPSPKKGQREGKAVLEEKSQSKRTKKQIREELKQTKLTMGKAIVKLVKKVKKIEVVLKKRHMVLTDSEDEDAENSSKQGRNLQEEGLDEMVRSIMKEKSEEFETPTQGKTLGEADISLEGLEAVETLAKVLTQRTKTYTRKVKTGLRRKLDADEVSTGEGINTGFTDVNTAFEEINSGNESIIPSPKKGQREGKAVLEEKSQSKKTKKHIREEQASLAKIV
ncbi:hypothetical protein Tco_1257227, partial [Tanacetum coccineum]